MASHRIDKCMKRFLKQIFCVVGRNSPYSIRDFLCVLLDAVEHTDFTNNTCVRVGGPTGETVFDRLKGADFEKIKKAFYSVLRDILGVMNRLLRNRHVALAFDITDEAFYGKVEGLWIHPQKPEKGSTGCFKYLTVSCIDRNNKFILGSLPVRIGADTVELVMELVDQARNFIVPEILLFDRGFDNNRLVEALQCARLRYQILWRKDKWAKQKFRKMKRGEVREVNRVGTYTHNMTKYRLRMRFVLIKQYRRYNRGKAYNWVFATNTRQHWPHQYVDTYRMRWGIETAFRVLDNIQIKTTTKNPVIRFFINLFCCLVYNLWKLANVLETPTMTFKNFVCKIVDELKIIIARNKTVLKDKPPT